MRWQSCSCSAWGCDHLCLSPPASNSPFFLCPWSSRNIHAASALHAAFTAALSQGPNFLLFVSQVLQFPVHACLHIPLACTYCWAFTRYDLITAGFTPYLVFCSKTGTSERRLQGTCNKRLFLQYCCKKPNATSSKKGIGKTGTK